MNKRLIIFTLSLVFLSGCSTRGTKVYKSKYISHKHGSSLRYNTKNKKDFFRLKLNPYVVRGVKYYPIKVKIGQSFNGISSWYGPQFDGKLTCNGEVYDMHAMTAAHKTFPMNTMVKVTNKLNGLSTVVRINDRGPFVDDRIIDLSKSAAKEIDMIGVGTAPVTLEIVDYDKSLKTQTVASPKQKKSAQPVKNTQDEKYALQLASFSEIEGALNVQKKYNNLDGYKTIIKDTQDDNGERLYKVWLIGFNSEEEIRDYKFNSDFENAFIVKED